MHTMETRNPKKIEISDCYGLITEGLTPEEKNSTFELKKINI